jgi:glutathione synthase/RimK-type ligase-like ATP-grasp enzyme
LERRRETVNQRYKISPDYSREGFITLNPEMISKTVMKNRKIAYIRFGIKCCEVKVGTSQELETDEILLSHEIMEELKIPAFLSYEMALDKNNISFGPFIGMLAERSEESLKEIIDNLKSYVYGYEEIGGVVLVFSTEGINQTSHTIRGFVFNPVTDSFEEGTYYYPASIFKRIGMVKELRDHFHTLLGDVVFNNYIFNKWEAHQWLNGFDSIKGHLPHTILYESPKGIREFLNEYDTAYVKPIYGSQGVGIIKVEKKGNWFFAYYSQEGEEKEVCFKSTMELNAFLKNNLNSGKFIVQKTLKLISTDERTIDFRALIIKDPYGVWQDIGMIARHGVKGSITSNVSTGGSAELAEITLKNMLKLSDEESSKFRKKMSSIAVNAAKGLEESGISCGNLGIDIGVDINGDIWIIEINNRDPNHTIALDAKDRQMFLRARLLNMLYAKKLAGF